MSATFGNPLKQVTKTSILHYLPTLREEWKRYGVERAWLFGSRSREEAELKSDWDFLVEFATPATFDTFMGLKLSLEDKLGGKVDILSQKACKPRFIEAIRDDLLDVT